VISALLLMSVAGGSALSSGCDETYHRDVSDQINILTRRADALVPPALERLVKIGPKAVPQIETAMHTAALPGRLMLLTALERIGSPASTAVLRHIALYDVNPEVRRRSEQILMTWAGASDHSDQSRRSDDLGSAATRALELVRRLRAQGEGPLIFGDAGVPGAPTVGAPEPVGLQLEKRP